VSVSNTTAGGAGLRHGNDGATQSFDNFELRRSPARVTDEHLERKLFDARGGYRGEMTVPGLDSRRSGWDDFGKEKIILLDAYRPSPLPLSVDRLLILENQK
jgi:hypothetical protein